jgi:hypothetical protein
MSDKDLLFCILKGKTLKSKTLLLSHVLLDFDTFLPLDDTFPIMSALIHRIFTN